MVLVCLTGQQTHRTWTTFRIYGRVPQIFPWRSNLPQSLAPTLIKCTYLWISNDLEDSDLHSQLCLIRVRAKLSRNGPDLRIPDLWGIVKRKMRNKRPKNADELKATVKEAWASIPPQQCHKLMTSIPRRIEAVIKAKGAPTKYWVHIL